MDGRTEGWKDRQTDRGKTVYPPHPSGSGGIINMQFKNHKYILEDAYHNYINCQAEKINM